MDIIMSKKAIGGIIEAPPSKSFVHRMLICAAAANSPTKIICSSFSEDTKATMRCLKSLGADFKISGGTVTVFPIENKSKEPCTLDCGESGSTLRFLIPFAAALGKNCIFTGSERLGKRPLKPLLDEIEAHGAKAAISEDSFLPCTLIGRISGGKYEIPADISSQFISGLLMALGICGGEIHTEGTLKSKKYVDITTEVMEKFGVKAEKTDYGYKVASGQMYKSPENIAAEGDWSNSAFWLAGGAIASENGLTCTNLSGTTQGDCEIYNILKKMGADITKNENEVTVKKSKLHAIDIDADDIPDLVPVLCVIASAAEGKTVITNTKRLREKESDRVITTVNMITALGGKIEFDENSITVTGAKLTGGVVDSANDHRISMSAAIASLICEDSVKITGAEAVRKSYPDFFEKFEKISFA